MNKLKCLILYVLDDDYQAIWEIDSFVKQQYKNDDIEVIDKLLIDEINNLLKLGFINLYQGFNFQGEEVLIEEFTIDVFWYKKHINQWKNISFKGSVFKFYITEIGRKCFINECNTEYFKNILH